MGVRRAVSAVLAILALAAPIGLGGVDAVGAVASPGLPPAPPDPGVTGPYAVGRTTFTVTDPARSGRTLQVDAWYPSDPAAASAFPRSVIDLVYTKLESPLAHADPPVAVPPTAAGFPLVVFSHGATAIRFQSYSLMEHLASHGYVVAAP